MSSVFSYISHSDLQDSRAKNESKMSAVFQKADKTNWLISSTNFGGSNDAHWEYVQQLSDNLGSLTLSMGSSSRGESADSLQSDYLFVVDRFDKTIYQWVSKLVGSDGGNGFPYKVVHEFHQFSLPAEVIQTENKINQNQTFYIDKNGYLYLGGDKVIMISKNNGEDWEKFFSLGEKPVTISANDEVMVVITDDPYKFYVAPTGSSNFKAYSPRDFGITDKYGYIFNNVFFNETIKTIYLIGNGDSGFILGLSYTVSPNDASLKSSFDAMSDIAVDTILGAKVADGNIFFQLNVCAVVDLGSPSKTVTQEISDQGGTSSDLARGEIPTPNIAVKDYISVPCLWFFNFSQQVYLDGGGNLYEGTNSGGSWKKSTVVPQ